MTRSTFEKRLRILAAVGVSLSAAVLAGCSAGDEAVTTDAPAAPVFSGPYAPDLAAVWQQSGSDFVREIIDDEVITDGEIAELGTRLSECLAAGGLTFGGFTDSNVDHSSGYSVGASSMADAEQNRVVDGCDEELGTMYLLPLRDNMSANPENIALEAFMIKCLARNGVVDSRYSEEEFLRDYADLSFPFMGTPEESVLWACQSDPTYVKQK